MFTTSASKVDDAKKLGADEVILTKERRHGSPNTTAPSTSSSTACPPLTTSTPYLSLLKRDGTLCTVGVPETPLAINAFAVVAARRNFSGSMIGGIAETQQMLDFCGKHNIVSDIELTSFKKIDKA